VILGKAWSRTETQGWKLLLLFINAAKTSCSEDSFQNVIAEIYQDAAWNYGRRRKTMIFNIQLF